ncbi:hypothetical protein, partial [Pseudomonas aeruginosa]|uniref:hypothetical protein n=2 Tax=Pseudomonas aeruginosa TaxID=287 RepID=UPI00287F74F0
DLCTKDGKFIGVSLNDMKDVFDWMVTHARIAPDHAALAQPSPTLPPFAEKVLAKLRRFYDCAEDFESGGVDIGRHWLDLLTQLGLLNRVQRSPALWEISQQGEDLLGTPHPSPAQAEKAEAERLREAYEWGYGDGQNNPNGYSDKKERDACVNELLKQPSPAQAEQHWPKLEKPAQVGAVRFSAGVSSRLVVEAAQRLYEFESTPEKEAERPEVVAVMESNGAGGKRLAQRFPIVNVFVGDELMTVAQHERIVKAWIERWKAYIELSAKIAAQRDAALAKLAELETALTPFAAVADAYDDSVDDDHEPYTDMGCDDRLRLTLSQHRAARTALSGAPSQAQHSVPEASEQEKEQGWTLDYRFVERVTDLAASRTEYTTSMEATEQVLLAARELLAAAPGKEGV